jgi:hypothetical protein
MEARRSQPPCATPLDEWTQTSTAVTLHLSAGDARRIVRALEESSVHLGSSPSGSRLASSYIRLAGVVRRQAAGTPPIELAG